MASDTTEKPKFILHWLDQSRAQRILWLFEELKLHYEVKTYKRGKDMQAPPELQKVHPLGKSPVVEVQIPDVPKPIILAESAALTEYLVDYFGKWLSPTRYPEGKEGQIGADTEEWLRYRYFMHYNEGSLMPLMVISLLVRNIRNAPVPFFIKPVTRGIAGKIETSFLNHNFKTHFDFLEQQLETSPGGGEYLCGKDITAADILMSLPLEAAYGRAGVDSDPDAHPKLNAYYKKLHERDAYQSAVKKIEEITGEPYKMVE